MACKSTSETTIATEERFLASPLHLQRLEHAVRLETFIDYVQQQLHNATSSSPEDSTENEYQSEVDGEFPDFKKVNGILTSQQERRSDRMKLYNFSKVKKNRKCLKNILLSDTSDSEDEDSDDSAYHMLKIHKVRASASIEFTTDPQLRRYQYYSTGLLSVNDRFYEHQKLVLSSKKKLKKGNKKKNKLKKRKMDTDDELSLSQQEEAIIREALKLEENTGIFGDENSLEPVPQPSKSRKKNPAAHEAVMNMKRRRLWVAIGKKEINRAQKQMNAAHKEILSNARRLAVACQRECRKSALLSQKVMKEIPSRARRLTKEMLLYWKRYDKVEKEHRKKAEKEAQEQLRMDIELREAKRQQRKLNFLITQTELYAHFMSKKIAGLKDEGQELILSQLNEVPSGDEQENSTFDDDYDVDVAKAEALKIAEDAFCIQQSKTKSFDHELSAVLRKKEDFDERFHLTEPSLDTEDFCQPQMFEGILKTYQLKGMNWLYNLYDKGINGILADEMGLGKTVQTVAFLATLAELQGIWGPFIIIAPASTLHNWQQEITKFVPTFKVLPYWGNTSDRKILRKFWSHKDLHTEKSSFHVLITSYQLVVQDVKYFSRIKWQYMVLDEAQAIKSTSSVRWKILLGFSCRNRLLLTGTPIQNSMAELWALLHFIMPTLFDSHNEFNEWFSKDIENHAENKSAIDEKHLSRLHMILKPFMLRRIKKDVENELSDKIEILRYCQLTRRQKILYKGLRNKISIDDLMQSSSSTSSQSSQSATSSLMNLVMQFRKVCNHPDLFERREPKSPFFMKLEPFTLPRLLFREVLLSCCSTVRPSVLHPDYIHHSIFPAENQSEKIYHWDCLFSFIRLINLSPTELSQTMLSGMLSRWFLSYLIFQDAYRIHHYKLWNAFPTNDIKRLLLSAVWRITRASLKFSSALRELVFVQPSLPLYTFATCTLYRMSETPQHYKMRLYKASLKDIGLQRCPKSGSICPKVITCVPTGIPSMLMQVSARVISTAFELYSYDPAFRWFHLRRKFKDPNQNKDLVEDRLQPATFHYQAPTGLTASIPISGWSQIIIADKESLVTDSGKLQELDSLLSKLKKGGHRVLIYSQMTRMIDLLEEYMWHRKHTYMRLDGSSKIADRRDMVADFQNRSDIFVFLLSTRAGGLGINLTAADTVVFYDSDWNPTVDQQAMDRAHRLGQTKQVTVYRLVCKDTIEERILQRAREKSEIQHMVISGGNFKPDTLKPKEVVSLLLDDEELERNFRQRQIEKRQMDEGGTREKKRKRKKLDKLTVKKVHMVEENLVSRAPSVNSTPDGDSLFSIDSVPPSPYSEHSFSSIALAHEESSNDSQLIVDDGSPSASPVMPSLLSIAGDGSTYTLSLAALSPGSPSLTSLQLSRRGGGRGRGRPRGSGRRTLRGRGSTLATAAAELAAAQAGKSAAYAAYGYTMPSPNQQSSNSPLPGKTSQRASYRGGARSMKRIHSVSQGHRLFYRSAGSKILSSKHTTSKESSSNCET